MHHHQLLADLFKELADQYEFDMNTEKWITSMHKIELLSKSIQDGAPLSLVESYHAEVEKQFEASTRRFELYFTLRNLEVPVLQ
jgi:hypothetical protein